MSHKSEEWSEFFAGDGGEPGGDVEPERQDEERALMLCAAAGSPERARKLLGFGSKQTIFRIARGDRVRSATLLQFRERIDQAEQTAAILRRRHWERVCGIPVAPLSKDELARLSDGLGQTEAAQLARELGLADDKPKSASSLADRMLARAPVENREFVRRSLELSAQKKEKK